MNLKQDLFCKEYLIDLNATKAAKRAGYSEDSAKTIGYELLNNPEVAGKISNLMLERSARCEVSADDVLREFKSVGMSNIQDYLDDNLEMVTLSSIPKDKAKAIKSIKKVVVESEFGSRTTTEFVLHDKIAGLNNIGKHIGFFEKDNEQSKPTIQITIDNNDAKLGE